MSGHSKWHTIKHKKGLIDSQRGKIFTRHANLITIAARGGGGLPDSNPTLRMAIDNAKKENVPNANIERAIKRGTGELKGENQLETVIYEGYGPAGTAIIVESLTDNKNRTYTNIRTIFSKKGGNLGGSGSVAWMFQRFGVIDVKTDNGKRDEIELAAIDAGAEDIKDEGQIMEIYTAPASLHEVSEKLKSQNIKIEKAELLLIPKNTIKIENEEDAKKILEFIDALEEDTDVTNVASNFDISEELMSKISN
jgi:YebC/PmpR family DNA-binding regulatory protein